MTEKMVGFIGLGIMGLPMSKNLVDAGYDIVGYNRSQDPINELVSHGGEDAETAKEAAEQVDVVISCLPDSEVVDEVMRADDGIMAGLSEGQTYIDMSTISPMVTEEIAADLDEMGVAMLDAPISGGEEGAIAGTLSVMVGGDADVLDTQRDLFETMGETITHCGPNGAGQVTKACNQIVCAGTIQAVSEALMFAQKGDANLEAVVNAISGGAAGCWTLDNRASSMIQGDFSPGFFAEYQYKDLRIATRAGEAFGSPMPQTSLVHEMYKSMVEMGMGQDDNSGVLQVLEALGDEEARVDD